LSAAAEYWDASDASPGDGLAVGADDGVSPGLVTPEGCWPVEDEALGVAEPPHPPRTRTVTAKIASRFARAMPNPSNRMADARLS
jgi:hypothetical protein